MDVLAGSAAAITIVGYGSRSVRSDIRRAAVSAARRSPRLPAAAARAAGATVADGGLAHNVEARESFMAVGVFRVRARSVGVLPPRQRPSPEGRRRRRGAVAASASRVD